MKDYKKKYDEALEIARGIINYYKEHNRDESSIEDLQEIFPELKESEDERIRRNIIAALKGEGYYDCDLTNECIAWLEKQSEPTDKGEISDGYHTFNELYYYRMLYNAAFFNMLPKEWVHKSKRHNDGEECFGGGWFIVMANLPTGQISNHYELKDWDLFQIPEKKVSDKWDGHTPQEAAERLHKYLLEKQSEQKPTEVRTIGYWHVEDAKQKPADKVEPKFRVKYAGSEYNVFEIKESAGITFYGIEDEPNHIDYVNAENCEIISGYAIKENGSPYPTKPAVFSEQNSAWSEEDEEMANDIIKGCISAEKAHHLVHTSKEIADWLKSLKCRMQGKEDKQ